MGFFAHFPEKDPGSYRAKTARNGQKWPFSPKRAENPGFRDPPAEGFTSTPRAGAPRFPGVPGTSPTPRRVESLLAAPGLEGEVMVLQWRLGEITRWSLFFMANPRY